MQVTREDIIEVKSWMNMFDVNYEVDYTGEDDIPPAGIVYYPALLEVFATTTKFWLGT